MILSGCIVVSKGASRSGFEQRTRWGIYQETELNEAGKKEASIEFRGSLWNWLFDGMPTPLSREEAEDRGTGDEEPD